MIPMSFDPQGSRILVVDDNPQNIAVLYEFLVESGFEVFVAENGHDALESAHEQSPDLILLDIMMPVMDGFEACQSLKNDPQTAFIPVIFITALTSTSDKVKGFQVGAVDYVTKPFQREEVIARVCTHLMVSKLQKQLQVQNEKLIKLNQEKNEFLGIAAHDLKNPLLAIKGLANLIAHYGDSLPLEKIQRHSFMIETSADQMFALVSNLLDVNRIETGRIEVYRDCQDILPIIKQLEENYQPRLVQKSLKLNFNHSHSSYIAFVDNHLVKQILDNLLSNAIKYSPPQRNIFVHVSQYDDKIQCIIADEGPGLNEEDQQKLFTKFTRLTPQPTGQEHSTGLGLFIVKKLVEILEGDIWCESVLNQGTQFFVTFPIQTCHSTSELD